MKIKKIIKNNNPEHTWDIEVPNIHSYVIKSNEVKLICHNSSATQNATNGIEPPRALMSYKSSKKASVPFLVPNIKTHGQHYQLAFDMPNNIGYLNICNVIQKWVDMAMSCNQYYNPVNYADRKIPYAEIIKDLIHFWKYGGKNLYYLNSEDGNKHFEEEKSGCNSGACTL